MRKVIVISVVVAGLFLHEATHLSNASPEAGGISPPAQPAAAADRAKLPSSRACTVLMEYFRGQKADTPEKKKSTIAGTIRFANGQLPFELESGEKARACDLGGNQADVVIAMAPHPVNSVLALAFDREIESIQRAATSAGYEFHQHYFPWTAPVSGQGGGAKKESGENRDSDREPGLLLFREPPGKRPLVVLLLPETPSGYLDPSAFNASMAYARQLDPGSDTIRVLGPFFSGTVPLLRKLIDEWRENDKKHESIHFDFISGSATAKEILKNLQRPPYEQFHSMVNDDEAALAAFKEYFQADGGLVLLSESGTAYGGQKFAIPGITFPREISRLRNANAQPGADSKAPLPALRLLPLDLRDSTPSQDIVRTFSGSQLPPSQEAVLLNIADQLRRERVRFVGILASDVHDEIFLAKFIATSCPNVRLFTLDPDLLFARAAEELPFAGLVTVGTYALLPRGVPLQGSNTVRHFPSQHAAGAYDAFRALLNRAGLCDARNGSLFQGHLRAAGEFQIELKHDKERKVVSLNVKDACREGAQQWMVSVGLQRLPSEWTGLNGEWAAGLCDHLDIPFDSQKVVSDPPHR